jgi:hypothetical protein
MTDGLGILNPIEAPFFEPVVREEGHGRDLPRKRRDERSTPLHSESAAGEEVPESAENEGVSEARTHIDLRV